MRQLSGHAVVNSTVMRLLRDRQAQVLDNKIAMDVHCAVVFIPVQFDMEGLRQLRSSEGGLRTATSRSNGAIFSRLSGDNHVSCSRPSRTGLYLECGKCYQL